MSNGLKGLTLAVGVIITCVVISIAFFVTREAKGIASQGITQIGEYTTEMANGGIEFYNGLIVSGNEVIRTAKKLGNKTDIYVATNDNKTLNPNGVKVEKVSWLNENVYVYGNFLGKVTYKEDGRVDRLTFIQQNN